MKLYTFEGPFEITRKLARNKDGWHVCVNLGESLRVEIFTLEKDAINRRDDISSQGFMAVVLRAKLGRLTQHIKKKGLKRIGRRYDWREHAIKKWIKEMAETIAMLFALLGETEHILRTNVLHVIQAAPYENFAFRVFSLEALNWFFKTGPPRVIARNLHEHLKGVKWYQATFMRSYQEIESKKTVRGRRQFGRGSRFRNLILV